MKTFFKVLSSICIFLSFIPVYAANEGGTLGAGKFGLSFFMREPVLFTFMAMEGGGITPGFFRLYGINAIYHVTDSIAIEPSIFWMNMYNEEKDGTDKETNESNLYGGSLAAFYYGNINGGLYLYTGPRISVMYDKSENRETGDPTRINTTSGWGVNAVIGLKYMFSENFGVFADLGFGYSTSKQTNDYNEDEEVNRQIMLGDSMLGVTFYF